MALCLLCISGGLYAQQYTVYKIDSFITQVRNNHPIAKQAGIITEKAKAALLSARGVYDPMLQSEADNKRFGGTPYYRYQHHSIKMFTPLGIDVKAGIENNSGVNKNTELTTGPASYIGIEIPLGKNLLLDSRRAVLQQAKILQQSAEQERILATNNILFSAYNAYYEWCAAYQLYNVYLGFTNAVSQRMQLVRVSYLQGDRSLADTIEAYTQYQNYALLTQQALQLKQDTYLELNKYLWNNNNEGYMLDQSYIPDTLLLNRKRTLIDIENILDNIVNVHPEIRYYNYKLQDLTIEKRLKYQSLLPTVNLSANALSKNYFSGDVFQVGNYSNNYKLGFQLKVPVLLRQGRGDYQQAKLKIQETQLVLNEKIWNIKNKIRQGYNKTVQLNNQLEQALAIQKNYLFLLKNEELRFTQGESSLFLINSRENKLLEIQEKIIELKFKYITSIIGIDLASGVLR
jgi:outer membrane protein TolC